ncbi:50S ribosomal protein L3 [Apiospora arundinis]
MAPRLPARWAASLSSASTTASASASVLTTRILLTEHHALLPRTAKRGVKYGWSTLPSRSRPTRFNQVSAGLPAPTAGPAAALKRKEATTPLRTGVLAVKKGVSAMFIGGLRTPCTILQMEQVEVVAAKTRAKNGYWAVQLGLGHKNAGNVTAPQLGYYEAKGMAPKRHLSEFKVRTEEGLLPVGVQLQPDWFKLGQFIDARSNSRGMGFAGGMKRHGFAGQGASHGNSKNHRTIGTTGPSQGGGSPCPPGQEDAWSTTRWALSSSRATSRAPRAASSRSATPSKKTPPAQTFIDKARRILMERNPDAETKLEQARLRHLELKEARKEGTIGEAMAATMTATPTTATETATAA